jgi:hypothetical protein
MKPIHIIRFGISNDIKESIQQIIISLEKNNYAVSSNFPAVRFLSRFIPDFYKDEDIICFGRKINKKNRGSIIVLNPNYQLVKVDEFYIEIKEKNNNVKKTVFSTEELI